MPRKSNQTQYDAMMSVFTYGDRSSRSSRHPPGPSRATDTHHTRPRSHTPHTSHRSDAAVASSYPTYSSQHLPGSSEGSGPSSPAGYPASEQTSAPHMGLPTQGMSYAATTYSGTPQYGSSNTSAPSAPAQRPPCWLIYINGQQNCYLPVRRHEVPEVQCTCGCFVRFIHLPTLVNWTPPFGVLWNFRTEGGGNAWYEGSAPSQCASMVKCANCNAPIHLYGPTTT